MHFSYECLIFAGIDSYLAVWFSIFAKHPDEFCTRFRIFAKHPDEFCTLTINSQLRFLIFVARRKFKFALYISLFALQGQLKRSMFENLWKGLFSTHEKTHRQYSIRTPCWQQNDCLFPEAIETRPSDGLAISCFPQSRSQRATADDPSVSLWQRGKGWCKGRGAVMELTVASYFLIVLINFFRVFFQDHETRKRKVFIVDVNWELSII